MRDDTAELCAIAMRMGRLGFDGRWRGKANSVERKGAHRRSRDEPRSAT